MFDHLQSLLKFNFFSLNRDISFTEFWKTGTLNELGLKLEAIVAAVPHINSNVSIKNLLKLVLPKLHYLVINTIIR